MTSSDSIVPSRGAEGDVFQCIVPVSSRAVQYVYGLDKLERCVDHKLPTRFFRARDLLEPLSHQAPLREGSRKTCLGIDYTPRALAPAVLLPVYGLWATCFAKWILEMSNCKL